MMGHGIVAGGLVRAGVLASRMASTTRRTRSQRSWRRAARGPAQAVLLSAVFNMLGALLVGTAVADTIAGIVTVSAAEAVAVIGAGVLGGRSLEPPHLVARPAVELRHTLSSAGSSAPLSQRTEAARCNWGGLDGWRPVGVLGVLIALALSPADRVRLGARCLIAARSASAQACDSARHCADQVR